MDFSPLIDIWHFVSFAVGASLVGWIWWTNFRYARIGFGALAVCIAWGGLLMGTEYVVANKQGSLEQLLYAAATHGRFWIAAGIGSVGALCLLLSIFQKIFGTPPKQPDLGI